MATLQTVLGTTGDDTLSTDLLKDFVVDGLAGDDTITIEETASALQVQSRGGEDLIVAAGGVSDSDKIKGGADSDTFDFQGAVSSTSIYGGKAGDSISFDRTITGGLVSGDTGNDTILVTGKIDGGAVIDGGADDDLITLNERITSSTVLGGAAQDTLVVTDNSESAVFKLGTDDDSLNITGKHGSLKAKGNAGDDTFTILSGLSGTGNAFYGGKGEDAVTLSSTAKVDIYGDKDDDTLTVGADVDSSGATLRGGDGDDVINAGASDDTNDTPEFVLKGDAGDDTITGSIGKDTIHGGAGDDVISAIVGTSNAEKKVINGDLGDDAITFNSGDASDVSGGDGDDTINVAAAAADGTGGHSITGGAGADVFGPSTGIVSTATADMGTASAPGNTTRLIYSSASEFLTQGDLVDSGTILADDVVMAVVAEKLTIKNTDEFDRIKLSDNSGVRDAAREGLYVTTGDSVTTGSSVVLSAVASDYLDGIDLSAGTTGNSSIDASASTNTNGLILVGGDGKNTLKGGAGTDTITGGDKVDSIIGGALADVLDGGKGADSLTGGTGDDEFNLLNAADGVDIITDATVGGSGDHINFSVANLEALSFVTDLVDLDAGSHGAGVAGAAMVFGDAADLSQAEDMVDFTGDEVLEIAGNYASASALQTNVRAYLKANGAYGAGDAFLAVYDDGADSYVALISTADGVANNALFDDAVVTNIAKLDGITDSSGMATSDIVLAA